MTTKPTSKQRWYSISNAADDAVEVSVFGDIGRFGIGSDQFRREILSAAKDAKTVRIRIHSYGGELFEGLAMHHIIKGLAARTEVTIDGLAASAATLLVMAADKIIMPENSYLMIHLPTAVFWGDAEGMGNFAKTMTKFEETLVNIYVDRSGAEPDDVRTFLKNETWFTAQEALEHGFADEVVESVRIAAYGGDPARFKAFPRNLVIEEAMADENQPNEAPKNEEAARLREIVALCKLAGRPELAAAYIEKDKTVDEVKALLVAEAEAKAAADAALDASHEAGKELPPVDLDPVKIYALWNQRSAA